MRYHIDLHHTDLRHTLWLLGQYWTDIWTLDAGYHPPTIVDRYLLPDELCSLGTVEVTHL